MPTLALLRHVAFEDLGLFARPFIERGYTIHTLDAGVDDIARPMLKADVVAICGGPIGVYDTDRYPFLHDEIELLRARLNADRPTLGLCLGAQMIAAAMGARVYRGEQKEIGWDYLTLTAAGLDSCLAPLERSPVLHWHGDTFELPLGAELLASSELYEHQAFSVGPNILAVQFHAEVDPARIEQWLIGHTAELAAAQIDIPALRRQTAHFRAQVQAVAPRVINSWIGQLTGLPAA